MQTDAPVRDLRPVALQVVQQRLAPVSAMLAAARKRHNDAVAMVTATSGEIASLEVLRAELLAEAERIEQEMTEGC